MVQRGMAQFTDINNGNSKDLSQFWSTSFGKSACKIKLHVSYNSLIDFDFCNPGFDYLLESMCFSFSGKHIKTHFKVVADFFFLMGKH